MKKLLIIAVASSFFFISCAKVEPTPESQRNTVSEVPLKPAPPQSYKVTNTETNWGVVEYKLTYLDNNFQVQTVSLSMGQSITICIIYGSLQTNFAHTLVALGNC